MVVVGYASNPEYKIPQDFFTESELTNKEYIRKNSNKWITAFDNAVSSSNAAAYEKLFCEGGCWRDIIAFTNDYRAITKANIFQAATDRLAITGASDTEIDGEPSIRQPFPGHTFINVKFRFNIKLGSAVGVTRLVKVSSGEWKAFVVLTTIDRIHGHPEHILENRPEGGHNHAKTYDQQRQEEVENPKPTVLVVGSGHNGLNIAARLNALGVRNLVIDKNSRVGDNWRSRYPSLALQDSIWGANLAYLQYPTSFPKYLSAGRLGNWLESYALIMGINVWSSSYVAKDETFYDKDRKIWNVTVLRNGVTPYQFKVSHIVMATGLGGGKPKMPAPFPGQEKFKNIIMHAFSHKSSAPYKGKTALVVGSGSSGHDISVDLANNGANVTLLQRSRTFVMSLENGIDTLNKGLYCDNGPPLEDADFITETVPKSVAVAYLKNLIPVIADMDKDLLDGLNKAGFKTWSGPHGSGHLYLSMQRNGGYYFDSGASKRIVNGDIKIQGSEIDHFTETSVVFKDGSSLNADVVIFATGVCGFEESCAETLGDNATKSLKQIWGLDEESELNSCYRDCGIPGVYFMVGPFPLSRFNSKIVALQIVAEQLGKFGERYTIEMQKSKGSYSPA
ncbi:hypothetical protein V1511DRAFT_502539 [Dipodascopsis uninucleata]